MMEGQAMYKGIRRNEIKDRYDVIVIGAGLGGLICANYLAKAGLTVLVVEQHSLPGGCCTSFSRKGYRFDAAVHLISSCGLRESTGNTLSELGVKIAFNKFESLPLNFPDLKIDLPSDLDLLEEEVKNYFPQDQANFERFFKDFRKIYRTILGYKKDDSILQDISRITHREFLLRYFDDPVIIDFLSFMWLLKGDRPDKISAYSLISVMGSYLKDGTYTIVGGAQKLSDSLCDALVSKNGAVLLSAKVIKIIISGNQAEGIILEDGVEIKAGRVVSNVDARQTLFDLIGKENLPSEYFDDVSKMKIGESPFELYLGVAYPEIVDFEGAYFPENNIDNIVLLIVSSKNNPGSAPPGKHAVVVTSVFPYKYDEVADWKEVKTRLENETLKILERHIPGIRDKIEVKDSSTPKTCQRYTLNYKGSAYGWAHTPDQTWIKRLDYKTPVSKLYLAGHWTRPGGGTHAVITSGKMAAALVLNDLAGGQATIKP